MGPPLACLGKMFLPLRKAEMANLSTWGRPRHPTPPPPHAPRMHWLICSFGLNAAAKNTCAANETRRGLPARAVSSFLPVAGWKQNPGFGETATVPKIAGKPSGSPPGLKHQRPWGQHCLPRGVEMPPKSPIRPGTAPAGHTQPPVCTGHRAGILPTQGQALVP